MVSQLPSVGTHADLLIISLHKLITTTQNRLQPLFDCLLTILVNVSPYLKSLCMLSASKLLHLLEAFSTPWFMASAPHNHHLVFFLLEAFNNLVQYQFDGNANLVYAIIRKRFASSYYPKSLRLNTARFGFAHDIVFCICFMREHLNFQLYLNIYLIFLF